MTTDLIPAVELVEGTPRVSSLSISDHFEKRHADVLSGIRKISSECAEEFNERNFSLVEYTDEKGEARPMYHLTRDGFTLVVMGFTGKKALQWKIRYIEAFNAMEEALANPPVQPGRPSRRTDDERKELTAMINVWVSCAPVHYAGARSIVNAHFGVKGVDEMTVEQVKEAIQFVQGKIVEAQKPVQVLPSYELALADTQARVETLTREIGVLLSECLSLYMEIEDIFTANLPRLSMQHGPNKLALASNLRRGSRSYLDSVRCGLEGLRHTCKTLSCYQA